MLPFSEKLVFQYCLAIGFEFQIKVYILLIQFSCFVWPNDKEIDSLFSYYLNIIIFFVRFTSLFAYKGYGFLNWSLYCLIMNFDFELINSLFSPFDHLYYLCLKTNIFICINEFICKGFYRINLWSYQDQYLTVISERQWNPRLSSSLLRIDYVNCEMHKSNHHNVPYPYLNHSSKTCPLSSRSSFNTQMLKSDPISRHIDCMQ